MLQFNTIQIVYIFEPKIFLPEEFLIPLSEEVEAWKWVRSNRIVE
jgi:hypothetical protein